LLFFYLIIRVTIFTTNGVIPAQLISDCRSTFRITAQLFGLPLNFSDYRSTFRITAQLFGLPLNFSDYRSTFRITAQLFGLPLNFSDYRSTFRITAQLFGLPLENGHCRFQALNRAFLLKNVKINNIVFEGGK